MAVTGSQLIALLAFDLFEDGGPTLGLITTTQFLNFLNLTLLDFYKEVCPRWLVDTQEIAESTASYSVPADMMRVEDAFLAGKLLEPATVASLSSLIRNWRTEEGLPSMWHSDQLPLGAIGLAPIPNYNSVSIPGADEPNPPHSQSGSFSITDISLNLLDPSQHQGLTLVGPQLPTAMSAIGGTVPLDDDFCWAYLLAGAEARAFQGDNEIKNEQAAEFCAALYAEGLAVLTAIME